MITSTGAGWELKEVKPAASPEEESSEEDGDADDEKSPLARGKHPRSSSPDSSGDSAGDKTPRTPRTPKSPDSEVPINIFLRQTDTSCILIVHDVWLTAHRLLAVISTHDDPQTYRPAHSIGHRGPDLRTALCTWNGVITHQLHRTMISPSNSE